MSTTLTIDVPGDLHAQLERQAKRNCRSLNDEVLEAFSETALHPADFLSLEED